MFNEQRLERMFRPQKEFLPLLGIGLGMGAMNMFGNIAGTAATNSTNLAIADKNNAFNAEEAVKNRNFTAYMSNTAHQREVDDLRAAGLNPLLSANAGASTPGGATASSSGNPVMQNPFGGVDFGGQLRDMVQLDQTIQNSQADVRVKNAQAASIISNTNLDPTRKALMLQQQDESKFRSHPNSFDQLVTRYLDRFGRYMESNVGRHKAQTRRQTEDMMKNMRPEDWSKIQNAIEKSPRFRKE